MNGATGADSRSVKLLGRRAYAAAEQCRFRASDPLSLQIWMGNRNPEQSLSIVGGLMGFISGVELSRVPRRGVLPAGCSQ